MSGKILKMWSIEFVLLLGLWFLLTGKVNFQEFCAGALTTLISLFAVHICIEEPLSRISTYPRYIFQAWRIPLNVLSGLYQVILALFLALFSRRAPGSAIQSVPFEPGDADDPESKTRRILALTFPVCSPNFVAIDIEREKGLYIYHQVKPTPPPKLLLNLSTTTRQKEATP